MPDHPQPIATIPLAVPNLIGRELEYLAECVRTNFVSTAGPFVGRFETMVAEASGAALAVATSSGTAALHAALLTVGVGPGDLVVCPSLTFVASANAIAHAGADPWLMDVAVESWTLDPNLMADALARDTRDDGGATVHWPTGRRVAAILPVYTLGLPPDMDAVIKIARRFRLPVVADAAAGLGAWYRGRPAAALGADLTMFSFNGNKTVTSGGGGVIAGDDPALVAAARHLTTTARTGAEYVHDRVGYNYRMTNLDAAVGCAQMENLDRFVDAKRRIAGRYNAAFAGEEGLAPFPCPSYAQSACWFSGVLLVGRWANASAPLRAILREAGIDARPFWRPMHLQVPFAGAPRTRVDVADDIWKRIITLPCSTGLGKAEQDYVISTLKRALRDL